MESRDPELFFCPTTRFSSRFQILISSFRQKIKKYNRDFEAEINGYRAGPDPVGYTSGEQEDEDEEPEEAPVPVVAAAKVEKPAKKQRPVAADSDESEGDESDWGSDSSASSESDIDLEGKAMEDLRKFFLKKDPSEKKQKDKKEEKVRKVAKEKVADDGRWEVVAPKEKALFPPNAEITHEVGLDRTGKTLFFRSI